jgi:hypothetical protein
MSLGGGFLVIVGFLCVSGEDSIRDYLDRNFLKPSTVGVPFTTASPQLPNLVVP